MTSLPSGRLPPGRPRLNLPLLIAKRKHPDISINDCIYINLVDPQADSHAALVKGLRRILPFMYRGREDAIKLYEKYGVDVGFHLPIPNKFDYQWAHTGEFLMCAYFEECENTVILSYKWRLNTTRKQYPFGMDLLAFDLRAIPPVIYLVAVKTSHGPQAGGKRLGAVSKAVAELNTYLSEARLDDDLAVIDANLHVEDETRKTFERWYDPYSQKISASKPKLVAVPAVVIDEKHWEDKYAAHAINHDFGIEGAVRILCIERLEDLVKETYLNLHE
jgi:hypothetical protein